MPSITQRSGKGEQIAASGRSPTYGPVLATLVWHNFLAQERNTNKVVRTCMVLHDAASCRCWAPPGFIKKYHEIERRGSAYPPV